MNIKDPEILLWDQYIERRHFGERPHVKGHRIPVATIEYRMRANNWTTTETAKDFAIDEILVIAALMYYKEHRETLDRQESEEHMRHQEMKRLYGGG